MQHSSAIFQLRPCHHRLQGGSELLRDVTITRDEIEGLMASLLYTDAPSTATTKLTDWVRQHAAVVGRHYHSELARRKDRRTAYSRL